MTILDDGFEPRPDATQRAAAQHRERETEPQTTVAVRRPTPSIVLVAALSMLIVALLIVASYQLSGGRPKALAVTPQPTIEKRAHEAPSAPFSAPQQPQPTDVARVSVYAAPDGAVLGPIEADRAISPVAHYGDAWIQADVAGSGLVWIRAADMPGLAIVGPDLAPLPPAAAAPPQAQPWSAPAVEVWVEAVPVQKETNGSRSVPVQKETNGSKSIAHEQVR